MVERAGLKVKKVYPTRLVCTSRADGPDAYFCLQRMAFNNGGGASRGDLLKWSHWSSCQSFQQPLPLPSLVDLESGRLYSILSPIVMISVFTFLGGYQTSEGDFSKQRGQDVGDSGHIQTCFAACDGLAVLRERRPVSMLHLCGAASYYVHHRLPSPTSVA